MSYEELSLSGFLKEMKEASSGFHPRKFCFVLGAGASKSSGIKSGQELVNIWDKELLERNEKNYLSWKKRLNITEENKYSFYSQYYEERFKRHPLDGYNYLEKLMEHAKPSVGYVMLSHLLSQTIHNVVITTNFDHLTEDAVNYYAQAIPLIIGHEALAHYISKQINRPTIIKIHHDLLFDPKNRADELETLHENWKRALGIIFTEYHPVFIGYAGNDNSLMDFLVDNSEKFLSNEWACPYWMIYRTDKVGGKVLEFLQNSNGYLIRHNGFDEVLYLLGAAFDYKLPTNEEFLKDAQKRFQALSNAIDEFTEKSSSGKKAVQNEDDSENRSAEDSEIDQAIQQITDPAEMQRMHREAVRLHNAGEYEKALEIRRELVKINPENAVYHNSLGITLHRMKRYEESAAAKRKAVELEPNTAVYHDNLSAALHCMGHYEEALSETEKAIELEPDNARYYDSLGITLHAMKHYEEAAEAKRKAVELEPNNAEYYDSLGRTLHTMKHYEEAAEAKRKAVELEPGNAEYHDSLSITLHRMGRYEEALKETEKAIELAPDNAEYYDSLGITLHAMKHYEEAAEAKRKAVKLAPDNAEYYNSLGITLHAMGRYKEAAEAKKKAVELDPQNANYKESLDRTLQEMEK